MVLVEQFAKCHRSPITARAYLYLITQQNLNVIADNNESQLLFQSHFPVPKAKNPTHVLEDISTYRLMNGRKYSSMGRLSRNSFEQ